MAGGPHGPLPARGGWGKLQHNPGDAPALPPHIKADFHARLDFSLDFAHAAAAGRALDRARLSTRLARSGGRGRGGLFFCPPEERRSRCGTAAAVLSDACLGAFCRRTWSGGGADPPGLHGAGGEVGDGGDGLRRSRRASQLPRAAVSSAACVIRAPRHDPTYLLMISSCPVSCGWALRRYWRRGERARGAAGAGRAAAEAAGRPQRSSSLAGEDGDARQTSPTTTRSSTSNSRCYSIPIPLSFTKIMQL